MTKIDELGSVGSESDQICFAGSCRSDLWWQGISSGAFLDWGKVNLSRKTVLCHICLGNSSTSCDRPVLITIGVYMKERKVSDVIEVPD